MREGLWERDDALGALDTALAAAETGTGSVVLVHGEPGVGKTSVVRALPRLAGGRARLLVGACDDLLTPRTLGPWHDVAAGTDDAGLMAALVAGRDQALTAIEDMLGDRPQPTVVVIEDVHWADEATLDVLLWIGRRVERLATVLVLTYRDTEASPLLQRLLGELHGPSVVRVPLGPLSRDAVARWAGGTTLTTATLYAITGGNPFFVSEVLAGGDTTVPATVVSAVLARVHLLDETPRRLLEQLAVVPTRVSLPLARALLDDMTGLAAAERAGIVEAGPSWFAFRHELARLAVEGALTSTERIRLHGRVLTALLAENDPDPARIVHHAVGAGDDTMVVAHAPEAARRATLAGAPQQAAGHYRHALERSDLLGADEHAAVAEAYAWTQYHGNRPGGGAAAASTAVDLREGGPAEPLAVALASLSVLQWADLQTDAALRSGERAVALLRDRDDSAARVYVRTFLGTLLVNIDREPEALEHLDEALAMADRVGYRQFDAICWIFRGRSRLQLGDPTGIVDCDRGLDLARDAGDHQAVMIGFLNTVCGLWMLGRFADMERYLDDGARYGQDREFHTLDLNREYFRAKLHLLRGEWRQADDLLVTMLAGPDIDHGLDRFAIPGLARLGARRGDPETAERIASAWRIADRARNSFTSVITALADLEHAWGHEDAERITSACTRASDLVARLDRPGHERNRAELLRWLHRLGHPATPFDGCPEEFAAGLRGDTPAAAAAWEALSAPYERALELAESDDAALVTEAITVFDQLGALPAAGRTRRRLRMLGAGPVPRGPQSSTRAHPAGLTGRQAEILALVAEDLTNAEIADRLVVSVRTVDHHVSAILAKLGTRSRADAVTTAARLGALR